MCFEQNDDLLKTHPLQVIMCYCDTWLEIIYDINPNGSRHASFYIFYSSLLELLVSVLAEMLDKGEQLIVTAFKVRVYTGIAHASTLKASVYIYFSI